MKGHTMRQFMDQLKSIAETRREEIGDEVLSTLRSIFPQHLAIVVRHASEMQPPNDAILGAAGMIAYDHASSELEIERDQYAEVARSVFPDANPGIPERKHISRFI